MTRIYNDPADFREEMITGFAAAYARYVRRVPDASGFVRSNGPSASKVSLVVGGGSGHYPSYSGLVGRGLADGCVLGDIFTSPSAEQVYRIARAAHGGAGVVLSFGNYAGDRLNFAAARERLEAEGINTRIVYVTDDIASSPPEQKQDRRGIAGTFAVYKIGGAAAELGGDLDTVEQAMWAANAATYSYGVAFNGCTLPGHDTPLFTVGAGEIAFGLGIHGEPGISTAASMPARELARQLVQGVLAERPQGCSDRVAVIINGLGATKYEELFVLTGSIFELLRDAGLQPVEPEVGELVTSLDMSGCSLSVTWLDDDLERYWTAPAETSAFRRGDLGALPNYTAIQVRSVTSAAQASVESASDQSMEQAALARLALDAMLATIADNETYLGQLDAVAGDGDHGSGMLRGTRAAVRASAAADGGVGTVLAAAGDAFSDRAGGTSGILWGILLSSLGASFGNQDRVTADSVRTATRSAAETLRRVGGAEPGDKTMLDALWPFVDRLDDELRSGADLAAAWRSAAANAQSAADDTRGLTPRVGRARPLAMRSVGTPDPGAISMALILTAVGEALISQTSEKGTSR